MHTIINKIVLEIMEKTYKHNKHFITDIGIFVLALVMATIATMAAVTHLVNYFGKKYILMILVVYVE